MTGQTKTASAAIAILVAIFVCAPAVSAEPKKAPEPNKMVVIDGAFFFAQGSWGLYNYESKKDRIPGKMLFSVLNPEQRNGKRHWWMEVGVESKDKDGAPINTVTRILAEETKDGPGDIADIIVQMKGYEPFTIPSWAMQKQEKGKRADRHVITPDRSKMTERQMTIAGKTITVLDTQAVDDKGRPIKATICLDVKPLGLVSADTDEISMSLVKWGDGAVSQIQGEPMNFVAWTALQVKKAMDGANKPGSGMDDYYSSSDDIKKLEAGAAKGNADAQYELGFKYFAGDLDPNGVPEDYKEAFKWGMKAADQGHAGGQWLLGILYCGGKGVPKNCQKCAEYWQKSAAQGYSNSISSLDRDYGKACR
ncbi:MAG: sel1 repeat family protein [Nitrospinae bacterium]|nr:sel1 repeat family protein [Nitrospinota bacterium]MBF0633095.1 sel1 repeat family protein [Nitrospinota bacterium]